MAEKNEFSPPASSDTKAASPSYSGRRTGQNPAKTAPPPAEKSLEAAKTLSGDGYFPANLAHLQPPKRMIDFFVYGKNGPEKKRIKAANYKVEGPAKHYVHVVPTDLEVPHTDPYVRPKPQEGAVAMLNPYYFFYTAAQILNEREAFNVKNCLEVYQVIKNLDASMVEDRFFFLLPDPRTGKASSRNKAVEELLAQKRCIIYGSKKISAADILHLPELNDLKVTDDILKIPKNLIPE